MFREQSIPQTIQNLDGAFMGEEETVMQC